MANSLDSDETAQNEPSRQDLHCLLNKLFWSAGMKGFRVNRLGRVMGKKTVVSFQSDEKLVFAIRYPYAAPSVLSN